MYGEVLPGLQGRRDGLEMAEVVGLEGVVVASAERGSRLDHLRHAARVRHREPLAPVGDERLLLMYSFMYSCSPRENECLHMHFIRTRVCH